MTSFVIQHPRYYFFAIRFPSSWMAVAATNSYTLTYRPAPADNPLKGFFPYAGSYSTFPHSMEWGYLPLRSLMAGPTNFDWTPLENLLSAIARRRHQAVFRVYLDYPSKPTGIPQYLLDAGLTTRTYTSAFGSWSTLATTNGTTSEWEFTDDLSARARLHRLVGTQSAHQVEPSLAQPFQDEGNGTIRNTSHRGCVQLFRLHPASSAAVSPEVLPPLARKERRNDEPV